MVAHRLDPRGSARQPGVDQPAERALRLGLATTLTLAGLKLAEVPGAEILILVVVSVAALTLVGAGVRKLLRGSAKQLPAAAEAGTPRTAGR